MSIFILHYTHHEKFIQLIVMICTCDAFSLNTIFISQPQPHPRDETDIQTKVQTQGLGIEIRVCHEKRSTKAALWGIISWLSRIKHNNTHSPKKRFISRFSCSQYFPPDFLPSVPSDWCPWPLPGAWALRADSASRSDIRRLLTETRSCPHPGPPPTKL